MRKHILSTLGICALGLSSALPSYADSLYLFVGDRAPDSTRTSAVHRFKLDSGPGQPASPAPSAGQTEARWGSIAKGKPYQGMRITDVAIAPNGDVYAVCRDTNSVIRFDGKTGADRGTVVRGLNNPDGIEIGPDGNLYITSNVAVVRCKPDGSPLPGDGQIGNIFSIGGRLQAASGLTFGPDGNLYVASQGTGQVLRYDGSSGRFMDVFCRSGILSPSEIAFGPDGNLYVASTAGPVIMSPESGYVAKFNGITGVPMGQFSLDAKGATGLAFGDKNDLYVSGYWNGAITRYDLATGKSLGVVASNPAGSSFYYLCIARQGDAPNSPLKPVQIKLPARPRNSMKPPIVTTGANTVRGWQNALKPKGVPGPLLNLAANRKTSYVISLAAKPTPADEKAASVLALWLKEMTGASFQIVREGAATKKKPSPKYISIGRTELLKKSGLKEATLDLGDEGYAITAKGQNLFLFGGKKRGAIYAVYTLLEEDLGCRWYTTGAGIRIPRVSQLSFKPAMRHAVPTLDIRDPYFADAFDTDWSLSNRTNSPNVVIPEEWGGYQRSAQFVHTYNALVPPSQYFAEHPEYFSEINGKRQPTQLCLSNPDVLRITIESVKRLLRAAPGSKHISVSPNDGTGYCECPLCSALDKAEATAPKSKSGTLIKFCNQVAEAIEPEFPDVKISTLAYLDTFMPPKTIRPRHNVAIQLCTDAHAWKYQFYFITESQEFQHAMMAWHAIGADIHIWDYPISYVHYMVPMPNMGVVTENMKFFLKYGAKGIMQQGDYSSPGGENSLMRSWVWAKQMWDMELDTRALMRDFIYGYYCDAAEPIWNYNMMLWKRWEEEHRIPVKLGEAPFGATKILPYAPCSAGPDWNFLDKAYLDETTRYFEQAEKLAKDPETLHRVKVAKLPLLYVKLGQGLGYIGEFGDYKPGSWVKSLDPKLKAYYQKLLSEFVEVTGSIGATSLSERVGTNQLTGKWRDLLEKDWTELPTVALSNTWKFRTDAQNAGLAAGWAIPETDVTSWADIKDNDSNKGWESQGFADYRGTAWYRQKLTIPAGFERRKNLYLFFGSIDLESEIYINGVKAFDHTLASTRLPADELWKAPFVFDPTPWLKFDGENTIAVKVSSNGGVRGIWKPAFLVSSDKELTVNQIADYVVRL